MNYQETLDWLFNQLPMYQSQGASAYKEDLSNTVLLAEHLRNPEKQFKSIHVAGTNGKGSTSHMIASVLQEAGYKVGLYTSPHLKDFRERIKINGLPISEEQVITFVEQNKTFFENNSLSFFEMTVGMAFQYFANENVDIAVIEVGLGGRLDSTNIITPELSVITNIGLDHCQFLGDTLPQIAKEKAGIIKEGIPVVVGEYQEETFSIFQEIAEYRNSTIISAFESTDEFELDLKGSYQIKNAKTAVQALKTLSGFNISEQMIVKGLKSVVSNTGLLGRWQVLNDKPYVVCDTAHNKEGLTYVLQQIASVDKHDLHIVLGVVSDKDIRAILRMFPKNATYYFCSPNIGRALPVKDLYQVAVEEGLRGKVYSSVSDAYTDALRVANNDDMIYIGGSTFVVAEVI